MKKLLTFALLLCLTLLAALPAFAEAAALTKEEITAYAESVLKNALTDNAYQSEQLEEGYLLRFAQYALKADSGQLTADSKISAIIMDNLTDVDELPGDLRGIQLNTSLDTLYAAYPLENKGLLGTRENAVLYISGDLPGQAAVGYLTRDGQRVTEVKHIVYFMATNGVETRQATYKISDGAVVAIDISFASDLLTLEDAKAELSAFQSIMEAKEYAANVSDVTNREAQIFGRDDLIFSSMDYLDLTPDAAKAILGDDFAEEWLEDGDTFIHVMEWNAATITFLHDKNKQLIRAESFYMDEDTLEGPRGIRVGDQQQVVVDAFYAEAGTAEGDITYFYRDQDDEAYGAAEFVSPGQVTVTYAYTEGDVTIQLILDMQNATLFSITIQTI